MRFILRKYVDAANAREALRLDRRTPVHDVYLKDGEEPKRDLQPKDLIGFALDTETAIGPYEDEPALNRKKR